MKKIIFISLICIFCLCGCSDKKSYVNDEKLKNEIITNLNKINEVTNMTSSNPYGYTNNEYYNNIVKMGKDAVHVLENMYKNNELSGLNAYLSALAIQDITNCNLYEKYNLDWTTADEFYSLWENNNCSFKDR